LRIAIVDLGCGNVGSVRMAVERQGVEPLVTNDAAEIAGADRVILPGVGAAGFAMRRIVELGLAPVLKNLKQPALGICLGMHLLFEDNEEDDAKTLGIIPGRVRKLESAADLPVPHMGWTKVEVSESTCGICSGDYFYFAHSFACDPGAGTVATASHSRPISAAVTHRNWLGVQFHPERSGKAGARLLASFLS
jgi:imidazole glycerol-phosphate synthase subunit HisH